MLSARQHRSPRTQCRSTRRWWMPATAARTFPPCSAGWKRRSGNREAAMGGEAFKAARDFLFAHRIDYRGAHAGFRWPQLDNFNYALDWFDAELAQGENAKRPALKIVGDGAASVTFGELAETSNRIANGLRTLGVRRGERILLMLGNVVPLWELMLAAMKLGAVVIPASTLLTPSDLKDRFERGRVRHLIANASDAA